MWLELGPHGEPAPERGAHHPLDLGTRPLLDSHHGRRMGRRRGTGRRYRGSTFNPETTPATRCSASVEAR